MLTETFAAIQKKLQLSLSTMGTSGLRYQPSSPPLSKILEAPTIKLRRGKIMSIMVMTDCV